MHNLESAIENWKAQHAKYEQLFSPAVISSRGFKMERLRQLNVIASRFTRAQIDGSTLRILKVERSLLEREIKVGWFQKYFARLMDAFKAKKENVQLLHKEATDAEEIRAGLQKAGFGQYSETAINRIKESGEPFTIAHSAYQSADERIDYSLRFVPAGNGGLKLDGYTATLLHTKTGEKREQHFSNAGNDTISAATAAVLLQGKAIREVKQNGEYTGQWIQYDLTDKDASGNFRVIRYDGVAYEKQLRDAIKQLPLAEGAASNREELMIRMGQGKETQVNLATSKAEVLVSIQANPRQGNVMVFNKAGEVIDPYRMAESTKMDEKRVSNEVKSRPHMRVVR